MLCYYCAHFNFTVLYCAVEEEKFIHEALDYQLGINESGARTYYKGKKLKQFVHYEDRFSDSRQTVVVWCLADFCRYRRYSEDVFAQYLKNKSRRELLRKRQSRGQQQGRRRGSRGNGPVPAQPGRTDSDR